MARRQGRGTDPSNHGGERCAMIDNAKQTAGLALVVLLVAAASSAAAAAPHYQAEIRRTAYGIPHIRAQDEASMGERTRVGSGKSVSVRVEISGRPIIKKHKKKKQI